MHSLKPNSNILRLTVSEEIIESHKYITDVDLSRPIIMALRMFMR